MSPYADKFLPPREAGSTTGESQIATLDEIAQVLFLDIVGFTRLPPIGQRSVLQKLQEIVRATKDFCAAKTTKELIALPTGDGMALVFLTAIGGSGAAISCAEKIAEAVLKHNEATREEDAKINVRMGIHSGNVVRVSDINDHPNVAGEGINTAQRVMDCGDRGHILLSDVAFRLRPTESHRADYFKSLGNVKVKHDQEVNLYSLCHDQIGNKKLPQRILSKKNEEQKRYNEIVAGIEKEWREDVKRWIVGGLLVLVLAASVALITWAVLKPSPPPSLAVLPFQPGTPQKNSSKVISKGLTEQFIRSFRYLTNVEPTPLSTVKRALNQNSSNQTAPSRVLSPLEVGKRLQVRYVLTGVAESSNDNPNLTDVYPDFDVDIHAELYDTEADKRVWENTYKSKPFDQLIAVQDAIMKEATAAMKGAIMKDTSDPGALHTRESKAHWFYMLGRFWSTERPYAESESQKGQDVAQNAIKSYEKAIWFDRNYALAHAGLADVYASIGGNSMAPIEALNKALGAGEDALDWGENCDIAEVYASIGTLKWWLERDFVAARIAFQMAIKINPQFADSHKRYSNYLAALGKDKEAKEEIDQALKLEPESAFYQLANGMNYFFARKYDDAKDQLRKTVANNPSMSVAHRFLAMALEEKKLYQEALDQLKNAEGESKVKAEADSKDSDVLGARAHILARWGGTSNQNEALNIALGLEKLRTEVKSQEKKSYVSPYNIAVSYAALPGKEEKSLQWIDTAIIEFDPRVTWLKVDPRFNELRKSKPEEFKKLLQFVGLPPD